MADPVFLVPETKGSYLATITLWRDARGSVRAELADMPPHVIEQIQGHNSIPRQFTRLARWCESAVDSFLAQGCGFREPGKAIDRDTGQDLKA